MTGFAVRAAVLLIVALTFGMAGGRALAAEPADPYLWLEEIEGARALQWVKAHNARSLPELEAVPGFAGWRDKARRILEDPRRIVYPAGTAPSGVTADRVFNFWRDAQHPRGLWRVSPRAAYDEGAPEWHTLLDMDALETQEGRNFQLGGAVCLPPAYDRCLVRLSVGGRDAVELREFSLADGRFVPAAEGGFFLPEAKQDAVWIDADHLLVGSAATGATVSGYARAVRLWTRGTPFAASGVLLETAEGSMGLFPTVFGRGAARHAVIVEGLTFWTGRVHHLIDGRLQQAPLPDDADFRFVADLGDGSRGYALLRTAFAGIPAGSLVSYAVGEPMGAIEPVFSPGKTQAIADVDASGGALYLSLLDDVAARLKRLDRAEGAWRVADLPLPDNTALGLVATGPDDTLYANVTGFVEPARLLRFADGGAPRELARAPAFFDGSRFSVRQHFAVAKDGVRIPYFVVRPKDARGPLKTLYWSYGGFEVPLLPAYLSPEVQMWVEEGNQYVVANIRGGGEYGPRWHQAALREKRQTSYDDLHTVAEALKREGLASRIAVHGRSNGGLMASVAYTERPDLYDAAMVGVPLADMKRYHLLLAGASWMAEYGDPDGPDWEFIRKYSPYQNIRRNIRYPRVFFYTSTKDDRVHPGHARKMAARMEEYGHPIYYYENIDGGHAGVANLDEAAYRYALMLAYLHKELR